jgi:hypothetical protein
MMISEFIQKMSGTDLLDLRKILVENEEVKIAVKRFKKNYKGKNIDLDLVRFGYIIGKYSLIDEDEAKKTKPPQKPLVKRKAAKTSNARKGIRSNISQRSRQEAENERRDRRPVGFTDEEIRYIRSRR